MELREKEIEAVADAVLQSEVCDLTDLQLALIGGGIGETAI